MKADMINYTYYKKREVRYMKRTGILLLTLLLLSGCAKSGEVETIVLEYAADITSVALPEDFYPDFLGQDSVIGRIGWYDGEFHRKKSDGSVYYCPVGGGEAGVVNSYENGEPVTSVRFLTEEGDVNIPILFGSFTSDEIGAVMPEVFGLYPTEKGAVLITANEIIALTSGGETGRVQVKQVISVNYCPDGLCVLAYDDVADRHVYLLNDSGQPEEVAINLPGKAMTAFFLMDGRGYFADKEGIFSAEGDLILRFSESGWLPDDIEDIRMDGDEDFTVLGTHAGTGKYGVYEMKKSTGKTERILVDAVYDVNAGRNIPEAAAMFNAKSGEYFVRCTELPESEGSLGVLDRVLLENDGTDLAVLPEAAPLDDYVAKGVFLDLSACLDPSDFMDCAREALMTDGKLYTVSAGFMVRTYSGRTEFLPENWTYDDLFRLHGSLGEKQRMFYGEYPEDLLWGTASLISGDTVDAQTLARLFELLAYEREDRETLERRPSETEPYVTGEILLHPAMVNSVDTYVQMKAYAGWEEPRIIGYPSAGGSVHRIEFDNRIAVFADTNSAEGAAAFAEYLIRTYPITEAGRDFCSIPVSEACWEEWIGLLQQSGMTFAFEPGSANWWPGDVSGDPESVVVVPDDALCEEFRLWLNGLTPAEKIPDQVYAILTEELSAVKGGAVSPKDGAERAAGRIRLYLSEKN